MNDSYTQYRHGEYDRTTSIPLVSPAFVVCVCTRYRIRTSIVSYGLHQLMINPVLLVADVHKKGQATRPATICPTPHQLAMNVSTQLYLLGQNSRNTAVSKIKLPPPPKAERQTKRPRTTQFGAAPAAIANSEHMKSE